MNEDLERVTYFAETDARNKRVRFGIKKKDRSKHMYAIGKTGMGKSTLLESLAIQDIQNGEGLAFIDPHGKSADLLLEYVPEHRIKDVIYFAPFDLDHPVSFNVLEDVGAEKRHLVVNGLMSAFKRIWVDAFSARMEYILSNIMLALLEYPDSTLMGVNRMLVDKDFRNTVVNNITDPSVRSFWVDEYAKYTDKFAAEAAPAIQNKVGQFVANPLVRNIIGQPKSSFDIREIMDNKKILIINLSKGRVGEANANLLGAMIITKIYLAAMSRADMSETELKNAAEFYLYVDEFQSFANESFADILSESRKYKLALIIAHQYIEQMTEEVRAAVFGNVGSMVVFRVGAYDAAVFEKEFVPQFTAEDLVNLQQYQMYLKLMINGVTSPPFSAQGMMPIAKPPVMYVKEIIESSRAQFAKPRADVEDVIRQWHLDKILPGPNAAGGTSGAGGGQSGYGGQAAGSSIGVGGNGGYTKSGASRPSGAGMGSTGGGAPIRGEPAGGQRMPSRSPDRGSDRPGERSGDRMSSGGDRFRRPDQGQTGSFGGDQSRPRDFARGTPREGFQNNSNAPSASPMQPPRDRPVDRDRRREAPVIKTEKPFAKAFETLLAGGDPDSKHEDERGEHEGPSSTPAFEPAANPVDRERSLRDAINLNYLKDKKEEDMRAKNAAKEAKPQNILALKNALLGILGEQAPEVMVPGGQPEVAHVKAGSAGTVQPAHANAHVHPDRQHRHSRARSDNATLGHAHTHHENEKMAHNEHSATHASAHKAEEKPRHESHPHQSASRSIPKEPALDAEQKPGSSEVDLDTLSKLLG